MIAPAPIRAPAYTTAPAADRDAVAELQVGELDAPRRSSRGAAAAACRARRSPRSRSPRRSAMPAWTTRADADRDAVAEHRARAWITAPGAIETPSPSHRAGIDVGAGGDPVSGASAICTLAKPRASAAAPRARAPRAARWRRRSAARVPLGDAVDEVLALEPQRLDVRDPRREDVAAAGDVLAVAARSPRRSPCRRP